MDFFTNPFLAHSGEVESASSIFPLLPLVLLFAGVAIIGIIALRLITSRRRNLHPSLVAYVASMRNQGFSSQIIAHQLHQSGWDTKVIDEALAPGARHPLGLEVLRLGVITAFFAHAILAFLSPESIADVLENSSLTHPLYDVFPSLVTLIGINDLLLSLMIATGRFSFLTASWAALWIAGVVVVILGSTQGLGIATLVDILEHGAPFAIALFFAMIPTTAK